MNKYLLDSSLVTLCPQMMSDAFDVVIKRNGLGLGFSILGGVDGPWCGLIRIKKIFPLQPAWETGKLRPGDVLLKANGIPLSHLTLRQALDILRSQSKSASTTLTVSRPDGSGGGNDNANRKHVNRSYSYSSNTTSLWDEHPLVIPTPSAPAASSYFLNKDLDERSEEEEMDILSPLNEDIVGEFTVLLVKVNGSLGFTVKDSEDTTVLRHAVKALVKEPALSDGRIRPGDKLISANNVDTSTFSHSELVQFLRHCPDQVVLKLYRDASRSQTPVTSPDKPYYNSIDSYHKHKMLRYEAKEMVRSLQASRTSLHDVSHSSSTSSLHRRRPYSPKPSSSSINTSVTNILTAISPATSLPLVESPATPTSTSTPNNQHASLPPIYLAQKSIERLCIEDVTEDYNSTPISNNNNKRPKDLDLLNAGVKKKYAFNSFNNN